MTKINFKFYLQAFQIANCLDAAHYWLKIPCAINLTLLGFYKILYVFQLATFHIKYY